MQISGLIERISPDNLKQMNPGLRKIIITNLGKSSTDYRRLASPAYNDGLNFDITKIGLKKNHLNHNFLM